MRLEFCRMGLGAEVVGCSGCVGSNGPGDMEDDMDNIIRTLSLESDMDDAGSCCYVSGSL